MQIKFNATGKERKALVLAVNAFLGEPMNYMGAPTFSYIVGGYTIDRDGTLSGNGSVSDENNSRLLKILNERGFIGEVADRGDAEDMAEDADRLSIEMPMDGFTDNTISNLEKLVASKTALIKKALGVDALPIEVTEDRICFPWFSPSISPDETKAYTSFIAALCAVAREQKRVTAKEKPVDNEKYAFRCFLLRLGFIGDEYKDARKTLLAQLDGNAAFKSKIK